VSFSDLQSFLAHLERNGDLRRVNVEVDPLLEIPEIATRVVADDGPALLFQQVKGSRYPLAINILGSMRRIEAAIGMHPSMLGQMLINTIENLNPPSLKAVFSSRKELRRLLGGRKKLVRHGNSQEVTDEVPDLTQLPAIQCWPGDGGRFITLPLVITEDPLTRRSNLGVYRLHVYDSLRTGMHWQLQKGGGFHYHQAEKLGQPLEVAIALGGDPALILSAVLPLPEGLDELAFSGILRGAPTRMVRGKKISLRVPAEAEFILEGYVPPAERAQEGPFGDHFGHYSDPAAFPVFHLQTITHRRHPIYPAAVVGKPPQEDRAMGDATQEIMRPLVRMIQPEVRDLWAYFEAGFHNLLVISVESRYTKEPMKTALGLLGNGQVSLTKCAILVDQDVNVRDFSSVLEQVRRFFRPEHDFLLLPKVPLDTLDFTSYQMHLGSKMVIDATHAGKTFDPEQVSRITTDPRELCPNILDWRLMGDTLLVFQIREGAREAISRLQFSEEFRALKMLIAISPDVDIQNQTSLLWGIFTRFDPARDVQFPVMQMVGAAPIYRGTLGIDATWKTGYPEPLTMTPQITDLVTRRWESYWR
jgi:menaquinone biosynthesis decarboxylase